MKHREEIILGSKGSHRRTTNPIIRKIMSFFLLAGLIGFVTWALGNMDIQTRIKQAQIDVSKITHAVRLFRADFGRCPIGIEELIEPPEGIPYLQDGMDPWGRKYNMVCPARQEPQNVVIFSGGPDGDQSGADNISNLYTGLIR